MGVGPERFLFPPLNDVRDVEQIPLITSANFTQAAQHRNIEVGLLVRHPTLVERLAGYIDGLIDAEQLVRCTLA